MKGPSRIDSPITSKVDRYKMWAILFCKNDRGAKNKEYRIYV